MSCRRSRNTSYLDRLSAGFVVGVGVVVGDDDDDVELGSTLTSPPRLPLGAADVNGAHTTSAMPHACTANKPVWPKNQTITRI